MASSISILADVIISNDSAVRGVKNTVNQARTAVYGVIGGLDMRVQWRRGIHNSMIRVADSLTEVGTKLNSVANVALQGAANYRITDDVLAGRRPSAADKALLAHAARSAAFCGISDFLHGDGTIVENDGWYAKFGDNNYENDTAFKEHEQKDVDHFEDNLDYQYVRDPETGEKLPGDTAKFASREGTVAELEAGYKVEDSVWSHKNSDSGDAGSYSYEVKAVSGEFHANASAGLYVYDKDGKRVLAPSVQAEVGGSFSVFEAEAEGRLGSEYFGLYGKGEVAVGQVEAKATASATIFDNNGNFNPELHGKASVEAVAFKAEGSVGGTVMGVDMGVNGSFVVGVGAHAEAGYTDGKLKVDIGASFGVGFSVGFEIDIGGAVDAVASVAGSVWDGITGFFGF